MREKKNVEEKRKPVKISIDVIMNSLFLINRNRCISDKILDLEEFMMTKKKMKGVYKITEQII
jgi:hypothetical protein